MSASANKVGNSQMRTVRKWLTYEEGIEPLLLVVKCPVDKSRPGACGPRPGMPGRVGPLPPAGLDAALSRPRPGSAALPGLVTCRGREPCGAGFVLRARRPRWLPRPVPGPRTPPVSHNGRRRGLVQKDGRFADVGAAPLVTRLAGLWITVKMTLCTTYTSSRIHAKSSRAARGAARLGTPDAFSGTVIRHNLSRMLRFAAGNRHSRQHPWRLQ